MVVIGLVLATLLLLFLAYETRQVLTWVLISVFFAVALHPAVNWVTRRVAFRRRWLATLLVFLVAFLLIVGLVTLFVVPLVRQGAQVIDEFPKIVEDARAGRGPIGNLIERFNLLEYAQNNADRIREYASGLGAPTLAILRGAATTVAGIATIWDTRRGRLKEQPTVGEDRIPVETPPADRSPAGAPPVDRAPGDRNPADGSATPVRAGGAAARRPGTSTS